MLPPRTQQQFSVAASRRQPHAAAFTVIHAIAFTLPLAHSSICAADLAGALCRWIRTTQSAFFNAEHDAGGREPARAGAGRGGAVRGWAGGGFLKRGVLRWGGGLVMYVHILERGVKNGVKKRSWGWKSGQKETPSGQKETPSAQFVRKVGKSALESGKKNLSSGQ